MNGTELVTCGRCREQLLFGHAWKTVWDGKAWVNPYSPPYYHPACRPGIPNDIRRARERVGSVLEHVLPTVFFGGLFFVIPLVFWGTFLLHTVFGVDVRGAQVWLEPLMGWSVAWLFVGPFILLGGVVLLVRRLRRGPTSKDDEIREIIKYLESGWQGKPR